ncbi:hypothetical protein [Myxococcus eversor]|nr:hypothetical protein [Myxococcus eversor]
MLASDDPPSLTGSAFVIDGGMTVALQARVVSGCTAARHGACRAR